MPTVNITGSDDDDTLIVNTSSPTDTQVGLRGLDGNDYLEHSPSIAFDPDGPAWARATLDGGRGADTMVGSLGPDTYYVDSGQDVIIEPDFDGPINTSTSRLLGNDLVGSSAYSYRLSDNLEHLYMIAGSAVRGIGNELDNFIYGNYRDNVLIGHDGNDTIRPGAGDDFVNGGSEVDTISFTSFGNVTVNLFLTTPQETGEGTDIILHFENVATYRGNDHVLGNNRDNRITTDYGEDTVYAAGGNDSIDGGPSSDYLVGGNGDDWLYGGTGIDERGGYLPNQDTLTGGAGNDVFVFSQDSDSDFIRDFEIGNDLIELRNDIGVSGFSDLQIERQGRSTLILAGDVQITLRGINPADLSENDFVFA